MTFFESTSGAQHSFEHALSHEAADIIDWSPAMRSFHRASTATSTAPSANAAQRSAMAAVTRSAHSGLDLHSLVATGALQSALTASGFHSSRFPLSAARGGGSGAMPAADGRALAAHVGIGPVAGIGLLPLSLTSSYEVFAGLSAGHSADAVVRALVECVTMKSVEIGARWGRLSSFVAIDPMCVSVTHMADFAAAVPQQSAATAMGAAASTGAAAVGHDDMATSSATSRSAAARRAPSSAPSSAAAAKSSAAPAVGGGRHSGQRNPAANEQRAAAFSSAPPPSSSVVATPASTQSTSAPVAAANARRLRTGVGIVVKRDFASGINLWWGVAGDVSPHAHVAAHCDALRRWTTSLSAHIPEWNLRLAARLRMNVITYRCTVIDAGLAYRWSDAVTVRASSSTSGVAVGFTATDGLSSVVAPAVRAVASRWPAIVTATESAARAVGKVDLTAGLLSRFPGKPLVSGFFVVHFS